MSVGLNLPSSIPTPGDGDPFRPRPLHDPETPPASGQAEAPRRRSFRPEPADEVFIPVAPMLDMAFQLLAFFIMTFKPPTAEMHVDLYLPVAAVAMPKQADGRAQADSARIESELENDLLIRAEADELGDLKSLRLSEVSIPDADALGDRLRRYARTLGNQTLRVRIAADDRLRYEPVARVIAACSAAGVSSIRFAPPGTGTAGPSAEAPKAGGSP